MFCIGGNKHVSLVAVDAGLSFSSRSAILSLWTESDKIFVRVGKSEATEVQFAKRCDPNEMDELIFELTITVNVGAEAVGNNWIYYEALLNYQRYHMTRSH